MQSALMQTNMSSAKTKRFGEASEEEINSKRLKVNSDNTIRANLKAARILRDYLKEKGEQTNFEDFDEDRLAGTLSHLYVNIRKPDGDRYKVTSLENIRHSLNRYLKSPPYNKKWDIIKSPAFAEANVNFKAAMVELKRMGYGNVIHYPVINEPDRAKMYTSMHMSPKTPYGLFNKVHFDIRLYFFRRGAENITKMTKSTFAVDTDMKTGLKYVKKNTDELTKNHRENDKEMCNGIMPETPGSPFCPVASFESYLRKLHKSNELLWQRPRDSFCDEDIAWYCNVSVGEKKLSSFMSDLSKSCKLSQVYTNHSIRTTGATILSKGLYGPAQIMAVTGHKSVQSLTIYQRVDTDERIQMGQSLTKSLIPHDQLSHHPSPAVASRSDVCASSTPTTSNTSTESYEGMSDHLDGVNLEDIFCDFTENNVSLQKKAYQLTRPNIYKDCKITVIHNLTINK